MQVLQEASGCREPLPILAAAASFGASCESGRRPSRRRSFAHIGGARSGRSDPDQLRGASRTAGPQWRISLPGQPAGEAWPWSVDDSDVAVCSEGSARDAVVPRGVGRLVAFRRPSGSEWMAPSLRRAGAVARCDARGGALCVADAAPRLVHSACACVVAARGPAAARRAGALRWAVRHGPLAGGCLRVLRARAHGFARACSGLSEISCFFLPKLFASGGLLRWLVLSLGEMAFLCVFCFGSSSVVDRAQAILGRVQPSLGGAQASLGCIRLNRVPPKLGRF